MLSSLFILDMSAEIKQASCICRAGASSVAELAAMSRPALLVPYPHAMDNHQTANTQVVHDIGGGTAPRIRNGCRFAGRQIAA